MEGSSEIEQEITIDKDKTVVLVIGMAGSGKSTFVKKLSQKIVLEEPHDASVIVNLDPAVAYLPYNADIDIRDKLKIKKLMQAHQLGPNGAIMTALNLYCSQIDKLMDQIAERKSSTNSIIVDTPGQIEVFTWSASGMIITQALSSTYPTVLLYIIDIARCQDPNSFMSNMLFCCSIFYKMRLPMVVVLNKEDVADKAKIYEWMADSEKLMDAMKEDDNFLSQLSKSMVLSLEEFYSEMKMVAVSSVNGTGFEDLFAAIKKAKEEYFEVTLPDLKAGREKTIQMEKARQQKELERFKRDHEKLMEEAKKQPQQYPFQVSVSQGGAAQQSTLKAAKKTEQPVKPPPKQNQQGEKSAPQVQAQVQAPAGATQNAEDVQTSPESVQEEISKKLKISDQ